MKPSKLKLLKVIVFYGLIAFNGVQFFLSFYKLIKGWNDSIHLTFIDVDNNRVFRHPLYTVRN